MIQRLESGIEPWGDIPPGIFSLRRDLLIGDRRPQVYDQEADTLGCQSMCPDDSCDTVTTEALAVVSHAYRYGYMLVDLQHGGDTLSEQAE